MRTNPLTWVCVVALAIASGTASGWVAAGVRGNRGDASSTFGAGSSLPRETYTVARQVISPTLSLDGTVVADGPRDLAVRAGLAVSDNAYAIAFDSPRIRALIKGGPGPFPCPFEKFIPSQDPNGGAVQCRVPTTERAVEGLPVIVFVQLQQPFQAIAVPLTAVIGGGGEGTVIVVDHKQHTTPRRVRLGLRDDSYQEIKSGLSPGESILSTPGLDDAAITP